MVFVGPIQPWDSLPPRIVGILGEAGSGKDTIAAFALKFVPGESFALADPMKHFAQTVFGFTQEQLWGPSACRNAVDERLSFPVKPVSEPRSGFWAWLLNLKPKPPVKPVWSTEEVYGEREECWARFHEASIPWLNDVLPPDFPLAEGLLRLRRWMTDVMAQKTLTPRYVLQTLGTEFGRKISDTIWIDRGIRTAQEIIARGGWAIIKDVRFLNEARLLRAAGAEVWRVHRPGLDTAATAKAGVAGHLSEMEQRSPEMGALVTREIDNSGSLEALRGTVCSALAQG